MAPPPYSDLPEVYANPEQNLPETALPRPLEHSTPAHSLPEALSVPQTDGKETPSIGAGGYTAVPGGSGAAKSRICGLKRKTFLILAAVIAVLVIGAIVGGAVGGTVGKSSSNSSKSAETTSPSKPSAAPKSTSSILPISSLASTNWTDTDGYQHYYVFHQDRNNNIIESYYDSQNKTWNTRSVSASVKTGGYSVDALKGTPLTTVSWTDEDNDWNIRLYFLLSNNKAGELLVGDNTAKGQWVQGNLALDASVFVGEGSNLAAWRPQGGNSTWPPVLLMYQDSQKMIRFTESGDNWGAQLTFDIATNKSGLALSALEVNGTQWRFYYDSSNSLQEGYFSTDLTTYDDNDTHGDLDPSSTTNFAASCFDNVNIMVVNIRSDGSLMARWWNNTVWSDPKAPTLKDSPKGISASSNFTAISTHNDQRMYGIVDGVIYEWQFDSKTPLNWKYVGKVNSTL